MNIRLALVCMPLIAVSAVVVLAVVRIRGSKPAHRCFLAVGITVLLWQLSCIAELMARREMGVRYAFGFTIALSAFVALTFLMLTLNFYGLGEYVSRELIFLMMVLPCVTLFLALGGDRFGLLVRELVVVSTHPAYGITWAPGSWYWAHVGYCVLMLAMGLYHALNQHLQLPRSFRECSSLMVAAQMMISGTIAISALVSRGTALVLVSVGSCCAMVPLYVAIIHNDRMNYLYMARIHILDQLDSSIFILDKEHNIIEANEAARDSLRQWTGRDETESLEGVLGILKDMGARFEDAVEGEKGVDVTISTDSFNRVYNVREEILPDKSGRELGSFMVCTDVTRNRRLIHWLERTAGTDALTGLPNRGALGLRRSEFESDDALPLTVIAGDVDGLKRVNDTLGHHYGDQMLVAVGRVLRASAPSKGAVFRTGGDEFVILLPRTGSEEAMAVEQAIRREMAAIRIGSFTPTIALGSATRISQSLSLEEVMHQADRAMYRVKKHGRV